MEEQNGWVALKDALPKENKLVQLVSDGIDYDMKVFAERIGENFISLLTSKPIDLAAESGIRWAYVATPAHPAAKSEPSGWVRFDWDNKATWPETLRKIWLITDRIKLEDECIAYFDCNFFRNTEDWPNVQTEDACLYVFDCNFFRDTEDWGIEQELMQGEIRWCYVKLPSKPE